MMWIALSLAAIASTLITKSPKSLSILWVGFWVEFLTQRGMINMNVYEQMWKVLEVRATKTNNTAVLDAMCQISKEFEDDLREDFLRKFKEMDDGR